MRFNFTAVALVLSAVACNTDTNEPTPIDQLPISINGADGESAPVIDLGSVTYEDRILPRASFKITNNTREVLYAVAAFADAEAVGDGSDGSYDSASLLVSDFAPWDTILPEQTKPIGVTLDARTWRWKTGTYDVLVPLEASYFFEPTTGILDVVTRLQRIAGLTTGDNRLRVTWSIDCDLDDDGFDSFACGGEDCDDAAPAVNPDAVEDCDTVGIDDDCDGASDDPDAENATEYYFDDDGDGYGVGDPVLACRRPTVGFWATEDGDCNDETALETPGASAELRCSDGRDDDCNGLTDGADPACGA